MAPAPVAAPVASVSRPAAALAPAGAVRSARVASLHPLHSSSTCHCNSLIFLGILRWLIWSESNSFYCFVLPP